MNDIDKDILKTAEIILAGKGTVSCRDIYAALNCTAPLRARGKREPSLIHISRVLLRNGYKAEGKSRGGYTNYRKGD